MQILAISDIVIYRTRSERLHSDMYDFLGTASKAFCLHFSQALQSMSMQGSGNLGPAVIVFHETRHTKPLQNCKFNSYYYSTIKIQICQTINSSIGQTINAFKDQTIVLSIEENIV